MRQLLSMILVTIIICLSIVWIHNVILEWKDTVAKQQQHLKKGV